jgi:hypothetical protein
MPFPTLDCIPARPSEDMQGDAISFMPTLYNSCGCKRNK